MPGKPALQSNVIALMGAFSCLASELSKKGVLDVHDLVLNIQSTAAAHRANGGDAVANDLHALSEHLLKTVKDAPQAKRRP